MSEQSSQLSSKLQGISTAIRTADIRPQAVFCGFDLWLEVMGSGFTSMCNFVQGGEIATGEEPENSIVIPVLVIGGQIVVNFDPTLPPDDFYLRP